MVELGRLLPEEPVDVGIAAVHVRPSGGHEGLEPRGRVAERTAGPLHDVAELLLAIAAEERRALERSQPGADADGLQVVLHGFGNVGVRHVAGIVAGVEAVGIAGLGEQPLRLRRIVDGRRRLPEELEDVGDDAVGDP